MVQTIYTAHSSQLPAVHATYQSSHDYLRMHVCIIISMGSGLCRAYPVGGVDTPICHVGAQLIPDDLFELKFHQAWSTYALLSVILIAVAESL